MLDDLLREKEDEASQLSVKAVCAGIILRNFIEYSHSCNHTFCCKQQALLMSIKLISMLAKAARTCLQVLPTRHS